MTRSGRHTVLSEIDPFTKDDELRVVIETPRGSRNKYSYDPDCDCMRTARFEGRMRGDAIEGTFTSAPVLGGETQVGTWKVTRKRP